MTNKCLRFSGLALATALCAAQSLRAQTASPDTTPAAVVQRFVDGANTRSLDAMIATLAPDVAFRGLPGDTPLAIGRDSVRAFYARMFTGLPAGFTVHIASRTVDGSFVIDVERFSDAAGWSNRQATWIYQVTGGLIQHAWVLRQPRPPR